MQIKCLDSLPSHLPRTYHEVGQFACGQAGRALVSVVTTLEYFGYACMQLILLWHQLEVGHNKCMLYHLNLWWTIWKSTCTCRDYLQVFW